MHSGKEPQCILKKPQCILVKSDEFENSYSLLYFFLNPVYVAARSLRSLRSNDVKIWKIQNPISHVQLNTATWDLHQMVNYYHRS